MSAQQEAVWRTFLSGSTPVPSKEDALREAQAKAAAAEEEKGAIQQQLELMTAMLQAAEEELKLRSSQLELTNEMLRATEAELGRREEQLEITSQMLRTAEGEITRQGDEMSSMRRELVDLRGSLSNAARRTGTAPAPGTAVPVRGPKFGLAGAPKLGAAAAGCSSAADGGAGAELPPDHGIDKLIARLAVQAGPGDPPRASSPVELDGHATTLRAGPGERGRAGRPARVSISNGDERSQQRGKEAVLDSRSLLGHVRARQVNDRLPVTHTSVADLLASSDEED